MFEEKTGSGPELGKNWTEKFYSFEYLNKFALTGFI